MKASRLGAPFALGLIGLTLGLIACAVTLQAPAAPPSQPDAWLTYTSEDAAFAFDYPPGALISTSEDAALRFKLVYVRFPVTETQVYQGASVMVMENAAGMDLRAFVAARYAAAGREMPPQAQRAAGFQVNGRDAIKLERDEVIGSLDKYTVLVAGDGVVYRINLFGGGIGGPVEPPPSAEAMFDRLVRSFRVLDAPLKPRSQDPVQHSAIPFAEPPVAAVFTYPMRSAAGVNYGVPVGIVIGGVRMEWLDYAIRNLDQWRIKCYGVDWSRMLHTGEDWYREDYLTANTAGAPVYAVADGVVERHDPGISYPGNVVLIRHRLPDGRNIYSMYGHVTNVRVTQGQLVSRGQQIATVFNQGYVGRTPNRHPGWDSHLHFEMRWIRDAGNIYTPGTNAYNYNYPSCTYLYPGRGYTYLIHPDDYPYPGNGYVDGSDFIAARLEEPPGCGPVELVANGGFESGPPGAPWTATNSQGKADPLIYRSRPRTGRWGGWLGNILNYRDTLAQAVSMPADSTAATLTFWRYVQSAEPAGNGDDRLVVSLATPDGSPIGAPFIVTSAAPRNIWVKETVAFDLTGYPHPTARLSFTGENDGKNKSSFFVDDVSLVRQCPAGVNREWGVGSGLPPTPHSPLPTNDAPLNQQIYLPLAIHEPEPMEKDLALQATCTNRLLNGDFEDAASPAWTGVANTAATIYNVIPNGANSGVADPLIYTTRPRSGSRSGRIGSPNVNGYWNELLQAVQLPANVTNVTLTFWRYLDTQETSTTAAYDVFRVVLETERGVEIVAPLQIDNRSAGRGQWVQETLSLPNPHRYSGQKIWVSFKGQLDGNRPTALYVDDVELNVCAAQ
ncbi:MAG: M23 family metallopeptidase [Anaerolineae bacterium]|nr:M23 family metallopeptidase [Candidatus Roseilinea sp.]MDW8448531.1 M23 family metallopeptidase [Anaerolineae bacterium]